MATQTKQNCASGKARTGFDIVLIVCCSFCMVNVGIIGGIPVTAIFYVTFGEGIQTVLISLGLNHFWSVSISLLVTTVFWVLTTVPALIGIKKY